MSVVIYRGSGGWGGVDFTVSAELLPVFCVCFVSRRQSSSEILSSYYRNASQARSTIIQSPRQGIDEG